MKQGNIPHMRWSAISAEAHKGLPLRTAGERGGSEREGLQYKKNGGFCSIMKKDFVLWLAVSVVVMLALPWLAVTFVKGDAGMAVCLLLFFAVNPLYSVIIGVFAGNNIRNLWSLPVISAVLFLIGTWIFFDMGETAFILYAVGYLAVGIAAMLISMFIRKRMQK